MKVKDRQKICSHCEGRIAVEADTCLYCGMPLLEEGKMDSQGTSDSLYPPPYSHKGPTKPEKEFTQFKMATQKESSIELPSQPSAATSEEAHTELLPVFLALLGSILFVLGLMQGFFSEEGFLRLEWNAKYWFLFCLASAPMLYFALKKPSKKESD